MIFDVELVNFDFGTDVTYDQSGAIYKCIQEYGDDSFDPPEPGSSLDGKSAYEEHCISFCF